MIWLGQTTYVIVSLQLREDDNRRGCERSCRRGVNLYGLVSHRFRAQRYGLAQRQLLEPEFSAFPVVPRRGRSHHERSTGSHAVDDLQLRSHDAELRFIDDKPADNSEHARRRRGRYRYRFYYRAHGRRPFRASGKNSGADKRVDQRCGSLREQISQGLALHMIAGEGGLVIENARGWRCGACMNEPAGSVKFCMDFPL